MRIWSWGANNAGQLGLGFTSEQVSEPTEINWVKIFADRHPSCQQIFYISGGGCHTLFLGSNDTTTSFGASEASLVVLYRIGHTNLKVQGDSKFTFELTTDGSKSEQVACGWDFSIFLDSLGQVHTFGENSFGQLGRQTPANELEKSQVAEQLIFDDDLKFICISAGMRHGAGLAKLENDITVLYTWGDNSKGQLGLPQNRIGNKNLKALKPTRVILESESSHPILEVKPCLVRCSKHATLVLMDNDDIYGAGLSKFGIFGKNNCDRNGSIVPNFIKLPLPKLDCRVTDFRCGWNHVLILLENGNVLSWGRNNFRQLGRATDSMGFDWIPKQVDGLGEPIISIRCGTEHNLALGQSGKVYSWGWNEHDNCGAKSVHEDNQIIPLPTLVPIPGNDRVVLIGCGAGTGFAVSVESGDLEQP